MAASSDAGIHSPLPAKDSAVVVSIRGLSKRFEVARDILGRPTHWLSAVDDVDLDIRRGETMGLVGETGSGKSTLGELILRLTPATSGSIRYDGDDVLSAAPRQLAELRKRMQIVFQDPYSSLDPRMRVGNIIAEGMHGLGLGRAARRHRVGELLELVGLPPRFSQRYPHELSGGQRQRVALARALAVGAEFLVLDEPLSALDVSMQSQILNLLSDLQKRLHLTYLLISHDLSVVEHVADRVAVMYLGKIVEVASSEQLFAHPMHPYTQALLSAIPSVKSAVQVPKARIRLEGELPSPIDPPRHCRFASRCFRRITVCTKQDPPLEAIGGDGQHRIACFNPAPMDADGALPAGTVAWAARDAN
jgi:oligopeptide/dipeptide ABC transporter ATP-binding protein